MTRSARSLTRAAALLALCLTTTPALGQESSLSPAYKACMDASGGTTFGMRTCLGEEHERQDARLNRVYQALIGALSPEREEALRVAQRAWIRYRDANCDFYYDPQGGTAAGLAASSCLLSETADRADELERLGRTY